MTSKRRPQQSKRNRQLRADKAKRHKVRRCKKTQKVMFPNRDRAELEIEYRRALHANDLRRTPVRAYMCDSCGHWHLTSKREWVEAS